MSKIDHQVWSRNLEKIEKKGFGTAIPNYAWIFLKKFWLTTSHLGAREVTKWQPSDQKYQCNFLFKETTIVLNIYDFLVKLIILSSWDEVPLSRYFD